MSNIKPPKEQGLLAHIRFYQAMIGKHSLSMAEWKYFSRWYTHVRPNKDILEYEIPWINYPAMDKLKRLINKESIAFEYGSGCSTIFLARRVNQLHTVEHDRKWADKLQQHLTSNHITNVELEHIPEDDPSRSYPEIESPDAPEEYLSSHLHYQYRKFKNYCTTIDRFNDEHFDLISVDGRARTGCIRHSMPKLKKGGYLMLDNSERERYLFGLNKQNLNGNFELVQDRISPGPFKYRYWRTTLWKKIK